MHWPDELILPVERVDCVSLDLISEIRVRLAMDERPKEKLTNHVHKNPNITKAIRVDIHVNATHVEG